MIRTKRPAQSGDVVVNVVMVNIPKTVFPTTRARAIKLKCFQCMGYTGLNEDGSTGYKDASKFVRECDTSNCPNWFFRARANNNIMGGKVLSLTQWLKLFTGGGE